MVIADGRMLRGFDPNVSLRSVDPLLVKSASGGRGKVSFMEHGKSFTQCTSSRPPEDESSPKATKIYFVEEEED